MTALVLTVLAIVAAVLYGGANLIVARHGERWSAEQSAREASHPTTRH